MSYNSKNSLLRFCFNEYTKREIWYSAIALGLSTGVWYIVNLFLKIPQYLQKLYWLEFSGSVFLYGRFPQCGLDKLQRKNLPERLASSVMPRELILDRSSFESQEIAADTDRSVNFPMVHADAEMRRRHLDIQGSQCKSVNEKDSHLQGVVSPELQIFLPPYLLKPKKDQRPIAIEGRNDKEIKEAISDWEIVLTQKTPAIPAGK